MSTMTKVFVVLNCVMAIVLSCLTVAGAAGWANTQQLVQTEQRRADAESVRARQVEATAAASLAIKDDAIQERDRLLATAAQERARLDEQVATLRNELAKQTNMAVAAEAGRKKLEEILGVQTAELTNTQKQNQVLLAQSIELQTRNQRLSSRLLEVTGQLTIATDQARNLTEKNYALEQQLREKEQALASGRRVAAAPETPVGVMAVSPLVAGPIRGEIVNLDGRYASLNIGETSGVVAGMTFMVYRDGEYIGDLQIDTVRPKESGAKVVLVAKDRVVQVGDRVVYGYE